MSMERDRPDALRRDWRALAIVVALFVVTVWPLILFDLHGTNEAGDQQHYHLPVIRQFAEAWPAVDLRDYDSATTPGFHLLIAGAIQIVGENQVVLRAFASLFSLGLLLIVWRIAARLLNDPFNAIVFVLPILFSSYFIGSAAWLTTDNAGLLFPVLVIGSAVVAVNAPPVRASLWSIWIVLAVLIRQIHIWAVTPIVLTAAFHVPPIAKRFGINSWSSRAVVLTMLAVAMPFAVVALFFWSWGGMTPPSFTDQHGSGANFAFLSVTLALAGAFGIIPLVAMLIADRTAHAKLMPTASLWGVIAAIVAAIPPTSFDREAGRWGGAIWEVVRRTPDVFDRSLGMILAAAIGGVVLFVFSRVAIAAQRQRAVIILLISFLGWVVAQSMNAQAWQRYAEPMTLILLAWLSALAISSLPEAKKRLTIAWLIVAVIQLALSAYAVYYTAATKSSGA